MSQTREKSSMEKGVITSIEITFGAPFKLRFIFVLTTIILAVDLATLCSTDWFRSSNTRQGLWKTCVMTGNRTCCSSIKEVPAYLGATQGFGILIVVGMCLLLFCTLSIMEKKNKNPSYKTFEPFVWMGLLMSTLIFFNFLTVVIYGAMFSDDYSRVDAKLTSSYAFHAISMFAKLFYVIILCYLKTETRYIM